jgi:Protein of unknown function (DUF3866)
MALSLRRGRVSAVVEEVDGLIQLEVDGAPCIAYPALTGPVAVGDEVLVNVQARELELGSGGFDVLYANLTRGLGLDPEPGAHVMVHPYTPAQHAVRHVEEEDPLADHLGGMPVVCCTLHSQLAPVCAGIGAGCRVAYLQVAGAALPVSLSRALRALKARSLVETAVAVSPCLDGDHQAVNPASALGWAAAQGFEVVVCALGPGVVGTGSTLGHGGVAAAEAAHTASALGGRPVLAVRVSHADPRERHREVSHHTRAVLRLVAGDVTVAWPAGLAAPEWLAAREEVEVSDWREACDGLELEHMGRGPEDDPWFFAASFAAGRYARGLLA